MTDCGNKEQFVICFKWVDKGFDTHEGFIGIYNVDKIKADTLVTVVFIIIIIIIIICYYFTISKKYNTNVIV